MVDSYLGPYFDPDWYVLHCNNPIATEQALDHYLAFGRRNGLKPNRHVLSYVSPRDPMTFTRMDLSREIAVLSDAGVFDARWYARRSGVDEGEAVSHYLIEGAVQGLDPNPFFSSASYFKANADVAHAGTNPLWHYVMFGYAQRLPGASRTFGTRSGIDERVWRGGFKAYRRTTIE